MLYKVIKIATTQQPGQPQKREEALIACNLSLRLANARRDELMRDKMRPLYTGYTVRMDK